jgi:hypothetical protein
MAARDYTPIAAVNVSAVDQLIVGFEVSTNCRSWVSTEAEPRVQPLLGDVDLIAKVEFQRRWQIPDDRGLSST